MANPWLSIPLHDYEAHMALPRIAQAQMLAGVLGGMLAAHRPRSVAVIGCAGGNGFEGIDPAVTTRVVGVDINPMYIEAAGERFGPRLPGLELLTGDIQGDAVDFAPVELVFAGLVFEYVNARLVLPRLAARVVPGGVLGVVLQLPRPGAGPVTPSPYTSLAALAGTMHLVDPAHFAALAAAAGFDAGPREDETAAGKPFAVMTFRRRADRA